MRLVAVLTWLPLVSHSLLTQAIIIDQVRDFDLKWFNVLVVIHPFSTFPIFLVLNHQLKNLLSSLNLSTVDLLMTQCFWWLCPAILWYVVEQYLAMVFLFLKALILIIERPNLYHIHGVKWFDLEFYGFFLILIDVATRKILATNKKLWFLPVVWWSLRFFNKCRKPIIKCWSIPVPVHKTGNVLKRFKDNMTHW